MKTLRGKANLGIEEYTIINVVSVIRVIFFHKESIVDDVHKV